MCRKNAGTLFVLLVLFDTTKLLGTVLPLLSLLSRFFYGFGETISDQAVLWLKFLCCLKVIVDKSKSSGLTSSELCSESKHKHALLVLHVIHLGQTLLELGLGHISTSWMNHVSNLQQKHQTCIRTMSKSFSTASSRTGSLHLW